VVRAAGPAWFCLYPRPHPHPHPRPGPIAPPVESVELSEGRQLAYEELLQQVEASLEQERVLNNVLAYNTYSLIPFDTLMAAAAGSWPYWIDTWACVATIAEESAGAAVGG
jgi:hypothetical protein